MERTGSRANLMHLVLALVDLELTAVTAYLHFSLGGQLFTLNAQGYVALAATYGVAVLVPFPIVTRFAWLPRLGLAGYTLGTIGAYLWIGPYFSTGWIAKGVEVAIVALLLADLAGTYGSMRGLWRAIMGSLPFAGQRDGPRAA